MADLLSPQAGQAPTGGTDLLALTEEQRREQALQPREGEGEDARFKRLYGGISKPKVGFFEGLLRDFLQGLYQGGGDEAEAVVSALKEDDEGQRPGTTTLNPDGTVSYDPTPQSYHKNRLATIRGRREAFREQHPVASYSAEIAGSIPTSVALPQAKVAKGAGLMAQGGNAAFNAATQAFLYGFNAGEGDEINRAAQGAMTAAIAAPLAGVMSPAISAGADKIAKWRAIGAAAKKQGLSRSAYNRLLRAAEADDAVSGEGAKNIAAAGPDAMPADAGPSMASTVDSAMQSPGPAQRIGTQNIQNRVARSGQRLNTALDDTLGRPQGPRAVTKDIAQSTAPARQAAYDRAYSRPIDYASNAGREVEAVLARVPSKVGLQAVEEANEAMLMDPTIKGAKQIMAKVGRDGKVEFVEMPNMMQLDFLKRALGELAEDQVDPITRQTTGKGLRLSSLTRDLKRALVNANDDYGTAVRLGGDAIERKKAVWLGRNMFKPSTTREMVGEGLEDISDDAREEAIKGARSYIDDLLANVKQTQGVAASTGTPEAKAAVTEAVRAVKELSSRAAREKLVMLLGSRKAAARLLREVDRSARAMGLRAATAANSRTAARTIMHEENKALIEEGVVNKLRDGHYVQGMQELQQNLIGRTDAQKQQILEGVNKELVEYLTKTGRYGAVKKISDLFKSTKDIPAKQAKARALAELLAGRTISGATAPLVQE